MPINRELKPKMTVKKLEDMLRIWHTDDRVLVRDDKGNVYKITDCPFESGQEYSGVVLEIKRIKR